MRAITILQPWAHFIATGVKKVENRSWPTNYRGQLAIHAGKSLAWYKSLKSQFAAQFGVELPQQEDMAFGAIVAVASLVGCIPFEDSDAQKKYYGPWACGPQCWCLADVVRLEAPIPYRGQQGFFDVPDELLKQKWPEFSESLTDRTGTVQTGFDSPAIPS